jgi:hypothetical protein
VGEIEGPRIGYCANRDRLDELKHLLSELLAQAADLQTDGCR